VLRDWHCIEVHGRTKDALWLNQKPLTTRQFDGVISAFDGIDFLRRALSSLE